MVNGSSPCSGLLFDVMGGISQHRSHDAHVHGLPELTVALEGNELELHLESPAANIIGFEYMASTAEQSHIVEQAEATLKSAHKLFVFAGTRCDVKEVMVDVSAVENKGIGHHDDHDEDEHKHEHHNQH